MAVFCIPPKIVESLVDAFGNGQLDIFALQDPQLSSEARHELFNRYIKNEELTTWVNGKFEGALASTKADALLQWAQWMKQSGKVQQKPYDDMVAKIGKLEKAGALGPNQPQGYLKDLVALKLGLAVSEDDVAKILVHTKRLDELATDLADTGHYSKEYWKELKALNQFTDSLNPTHKLRVATSLIGRGMMLASVKSPVVNIVSNTVLGATEALNRRIASGQWKGLNNDFWKKYTKEAMNIYNETGYDISRIDDAWQGQMRLGEDVVHSEGPGKTRKFGRFVEDVIFDKAMGTPDAATAILSFSDSANMAIAKQVKNEGLTGVDAVTRGMELAREVTHTDVTTASQIAKDIRAKAIADARVATWTNDTGYSKAALWLRSGLNKATKDVRLGDQLMPFIKTPANVVSLGVDVAGVGFVKALYKTYQGIRTGEKAKIAEAVRDASRAGMGIALATLIVYSVNPEDSTGTYESYGLDQKARDLLKAKNAPFNAILMNTPLGKKWISYDYFGPLGPVMSGIMAGRKEQEPGAASWKYLQAAGQQIAKVPGIQEVQDLAGGWSDVSTQAPEKILPAAANTLGSFVKSRIIPGISGDIASAIDPYQREIGTGALQQTMAAIPGVRQLLPEKINQLTGDEMANEPAWSTLAFGRRVTTADNDRVLEEIDRLEKAGSGPAIQDIAKASPAVKTMKGQLNQTEYQTALVDYGTSYSSAVSQLMSSSEYRMMTDKQKASAINKIREDTMENMVIEHSKTLTPEQQNTKNKKRAKEILSQYYDTIPTEVWGTIERTYPGLRARAEKEAKLAESGTPAEKATAQRWFKTEPFGPIALNARKQIALKKIEVRQRNPLVGQAYDLINK
jgi:hypothetical protein